MNYKLPAFFLLTALFLSSCSSVKNVAYFQKLETTTDPSIQQSKASDVYDARIKPKDMLSITVVTSEPLASRNYNLIMPQISDGTTTSFLVSQPSLQTYLVDNDGTIDFPVFGKLKVEGMTRKEMEAMLQERLASSFNNERPIVTIRITNYTVNILGEVQRPGKFASTNERITIFEGLALAGDLTIRDARKRKSIARKCRWHQKLYYYKPHRRKQHPFLGLLPGAKRRSLRGTNKTKARTSRIGSAETLGISALSIVISLSSLVINILK